MRASENPLIVALDVPDADQALDLARRLRPHVAMVKLGLELFAAGGPQLVAALRQTGVDIFLDLKLHDIPRTAAAAAARLAHLDVRLLTVHAAGGGAMVQAVRDALPQQTSVLAVTVLTSLDVDTATQVGLGPDMAASAARLGKLARSHGADGLVCSAAELARLRPLGGLRVVPGIRPVGADVGDQKRVATPAAACRGGADYIVVGRPIVAADDPVAAAQAIVQSCWGDAA